MAGLRRLLTAAERRVARREPSKRERLERRAARMRERAQAEAAAWRIWRARRAGLVGGAARWRKARGAA